MRRISKKIKIFVVFIAFVAVNSKIIRTFALNHWHNDFRGGRR